MSKSERSAAPSGEGLEVRIDRGLCMSAGECLYNAPNTFALDDEDKSVPIDPHADEEETVLKAARACPNFAIAVFKNGKQIV